MKKKILVVDDEEGVRRILHMILKNLGCEVLEAASGDDAIRIYGENRDIHAVITDLEMGPGMDGLEVVKLIRGISPAVRICLASGALDSKPELIEAARNAGSDLILHKPMNVSDLRRAVGL